VDLLGPVAFGHIVSPVPPGYFFPPATTRSRLDALALFKPGGTCVIEATEEQWHGRTFRPITKATPQGSGAGAVAPSPTMLPRDQPTESQDELWRSRSQSINHYSPSIVSRAPLQSATSLHR
jgi:hypothetical protein